MDRIQQSIRSWSQNSCVALLGILALVHGRPISVLAAAGINTRFADTFSGIDSASPQNPDDVKDERAAEAIRSNALRVMDPKLHEAYRKTSDPVRRAELFCTAIGNRLAPTAPIGGVKQAKPNGPSIWRSLLLGVAGQFVPTEVPDLYEKVLKTAPSDPFAFNEDAANERAMAAQQAAKLVVREYLPGEDATFDSDPPVVRTRKLLQALLVLLDARAWPTTGLVYLSDYAVPDPKNPPFYQGRPGTWGKDFVRMLLGETSQQYLNWDVDTNPRRRGEALQGAFRSLFGRALMVVNDPPLLSTEDFKAQIQFNRWTFGADDRPRSVGEAFGKKDLATYRQLLKEYQQNDNGRTIDPARLKEMRGLYDGAVATIPTELWAFYFTIP